MTLAASVVFSYTGRQGQNWDVALRRRSGHPIFDIHANVLRGLHDNNENNIDNTDNYDNTAGV